jgi:hypothetical protein
LLIFTPSSDKDDFNLSVLDLSGDSKGLALFVPLEKSLTVCTLLIFLSVLSIRELDFDTAG